MAKGSDFQSHVHSSDESEADRRRRRITAGPVRRTLLLLAIPVLGEQVLNTFIGLFDTYLAGNLSQDVSVSATSAVGLAAYVGWLASMIVMLVGTGATALVARHEGQGNHRKANRFANQSMTLAAVLGLCLFALLYFLAPALAHYCRMTGAAYDVTVHYLRVDAFGHTFMSLTLVGCAALRGVGNMRTPLLIFLVVNTVNVIASCTLVYGLGPFPVFGVNGIVGGTVTARAVGLALTLTVLVRGKAGIILRRSELAVVWSQTRRILRIGIPAAADGAIMWTGHFIFLAIIARLADPPEGAAYFAAHIIAVRVEGFTYLPASAWAAALATMIGQSLGAGDAARARHAGHEAVFQCGLLACVVAVVFFFGARQIFGLMTVDPLVRSVGTQPFKILALLTPILIVSIVYVGGLRGAGDTRVPLLITVAGVILRVSLGAFFGLVLEWGLIGAWIGMFADMFWRAGAVAYRFCSGHWINTNV